MSDQEWRRMKGLWGGGSQQPEDQDVCNVSALQAQCWELQNSVSQFSKLVRSFSFYRKWEKLFK